MQTSDADEADGQLSTSSALNSNTHDKGTYNTPKIIFVCPHQLNRLSQPEQTLRHEKN